MKEQVIIKPLEGIEWGDKVVNLGSPLSSVNAVLGEAETVYENHYYYYDSNLRVDLDSNGNVEFIEFLAGIDGDIHPQIYGVSAFDIDADELIKILTEQNNGDIDDHENGYGYSFPDISVGVYRESISENVHQMIEEAEEEGEPMDEEEIEYEKRKAFHWATIGIGGKDYYL